MKRPEVAIIGLVAVAAVLWYVMSVLETLP